MSESKDDRTALKQQLDAANSREQEHLALIEEMKRSQAEERQQMQRQITTLRADLGLLQQRQINDASHKESNPHAKTT